MSHVGLSVVLVVLFAAAAVVMASPPGCAPGGPCVWTFVPPTPGFETRPNPNPTPTPTADIIIETQTQSRPDPDAADVVIEIETKTQTQAQAQSRLDPDVGEIKTHPVSSPDVVIIGSRVPSSSHPPTGVMIDTGSDDHQHVFVHVLAKASEAASALKRSAQSAAGVWVAAQSYAMAAMNSWSSIFDGE